MEQIGKDLKGSLACAAQDAGEGGGRRPRADRHAAQADRTLASTDALIGPDSTANAELRRALLELSEAARALGLAAEQIQTQPQSLIFGRRGSQ